MWNSIQYVGSGLSLVAFVVAAIVLGYRARLRRRMEIIKSAPEKERVEAIAVTAEFFRVDVSTLLPAMQQEIVLAQINARSRRDLLAASILILVAMFAGGIAFISIVTTKEGAANTSATHRVAAIYTACLGDQQTCQGSKAHITYFFGCNTLDVYPNDPDEGVAGSICNNFIKVERIASGNGGECGYKIIHVTCP